jgi:hypothetical protein
VVEGQWRRAAQGGGKGLGGSTKTFVFAARVDEPGAGMPEAATGVERLQLRLIVHMRPLDAALLRRQLGGATSLGSAGLGPWRSTLAWDRACLKSRLFEWNQPINPCHVVYVRFAKGLRELLLLSADEDHNADIQKDRGNKIDPG